MDSRLIKMAAEIGIQFPTVLPLFRSPPKKDAIERWVERHQVDSRLYPVARKLADSISYISFETFFNQLKETISDFRRHVRGEPYVLWIGSSTRSNHPDFSCHSDIWVPGLAFEYCGLHCPEEIVTTDKLNSYLIEHPEIKHVLILDDAAYSGSHYNDPRFLDHTNSQI